MVDTKNCKWLGNFPDLLTFNNGEKVTDASQWEARRKEVLDTAVNLLHGGMPPKPEVFKVHWLYSAGDKKSILIECGTKEKTVSFPVKIFMPHGVEKAPVYIFGDDCFGYNNTDTIKLFNDHGFAFALYDRTAIAPDNPADVRNVGIYTVYPDGKFGAIAAWAWEYQRCVDAMYELSFIDTDCIAIGGHSRGGKTTLLAGATDERIKFIHDSCSGCCGAACFRYEEYHDKEYTEKYHVGDRSENLDIITRNFPHWFSKDINAYIGREAELPFDMHFLKAAIAPRWYLQTNSLDDVWADPIGAYQTHLAAKEVFKLLGVEDHIASVYRYGEHAYRYTDFFTFIEFIEAARQGRPFLRENADATIQMNKLF